MASRISRPLLIRPAALAGKILLGLGLAVLPWAVLAFLLRTYCGAAITDAIPGEGDFVLYWHEIATYAAVGFKGGYYGFEEMVAPAARLGTGSFGAHSAFFPMLFGSVGAVLDWGPASGTLYCLGAVSLGVAGFVLLTWGDWRLHLLAGALLLTHVYMYCYLDKCSPEGVHVACAFLLAGLFIRRFEARTPRTRTALAILLYGIIFFVSLLRYSWGPAFVLLFFDVNDLGKRPDRNTLYRAGACLASIAAIYVVYNLFMAPYPYEPFPGSMFGLPVYLEALHGNAGPLLRLITENFHHVLFPKKLTFQDGIFYTFLLYMAVTALSGVLLLARRPSLPERRTTELRFVLFFMLAAMLPLLLLCLCYYYISLSGIGVRILLPVFIMSYLVTARYAPVPAIPVVLALFLGFLPMGLQTFQHWALPDYDAAFGDARAETANTRQVLAPLLAYQPEGNPWCNTIVTLDNDLPTAWMALPPGLSVQIMRYDPDAAEPFRYSPWHKFTKIRSRYVITKDARLIGKLAMENRLVFLADTPLGQLYRNDSSQCVLPSQNTP